MITTNQRKDILNTVKFELAFARFKRQHTFTDSDRVLLEQEQSQVLEVVDRILDGSDSVESFFADDYISTFLSALDAQGRDSSPN